MSKPLVVFDMDGVLVDVTESYRETIARTAEHFTGKKVTRERISGYKLISGYNDDWKLTHKLIEDEGMEVPFDEVKARFQELFLGAGNDGLITRERWVARPGVLERLNERYDFAIFTGRPRAEALLTLERNANGLVFDPIMALEDSLRPKPYPDGLRKIAGERTVACYVGDTLDDARCGILAKVPFIGVASPSDPRYADIARMFFVGKARAVIDDINYLEEALV